MTMNLPQTVGEISVQLDKLKKEAAQLKDTSDILLSALLPITRPAVAKAPEEKEDQCNTIMGQDIQKIRIGICKIRMAVEATAANLEL